MAMSFKKDIRQHLPKDAAKLLAELKSVGDELYKTRRQHDSIEAVVEGINSKRLDFKLRHAVYDKPDKEIPPFHLRVQTGLNKENKTSKQTVFSRDKVTIKSRNHNYFLDGSANYKDGDPNWALCNAVKDSKGDIKSAGIYHPVMGEFYYADKTSAYRIMLPRFKGEELTVKEFNIPPLRKKFAAEYASMHTQERSIFKAVFTSLVRENVGGSLHEVAMTETPAAWVGLGVRSHTVLGNSKMPEGEIGAFIAEKAGAVVVRDPILTDSKNRDMVFVMHPDVAKDVMKKFVKAVKLAKGDIVTENTKTLVEPSELHKQHGR